MSRDAVKTVQAYLNSTTNSRLRVDGVMGPHTAAVINANKDSDSLLTMLTKKLNINTQVAGVYTRAELVQLATEAAARTGAPFEYIMYAFYHENFPAGDGLRTEYDGTFRGLGQFGQVAWRDVGLPDWANGVKDPVLSAWAVGRYYMLNKARFEREFPGKEYTREIAYTYHNLGPGGAAGNLKGRPPSYLKVQSSKAQATARLARSQVNDRSFANFQVT